MFIAPVLHYLIDSSLALAGVDAVVFLLPIAWDYGAVYPTSLGTNFWTAQIKNNPKSANLTL